MGQAAEIAESLSGRNDRIVIRDLLVIHIACLFQTFEHIVLQDFLRKRRACRIIAKPPYILMDHLGHCRGKHTGIGSRIGRQLLFVQFLRDL